MYVWLISGFVLLVFCGDLLVRGAVSLAARLGVSSLVISLTIVALGTSMPELMIATDAALIGSPDIAIGNVVGSNIANILLVLGLPALIYPLACNQPSLRGNALMMIGASVILIVLAFIGPITRGEGFLLLVLTAIYFIWSREDVQKNKLEARTRAAEARAMALEVTKDETRLEERAEDVLHKDIPSTSVSWLVIGGYILIGCIGLPIGAHLVVIGGTDIARAFAVPESVIALSLIAVGTSLPEISTSLVAAWRREEGVAIGNVIGSNILNILAILGVASFVAPITVAPEFLHVDLWVMLITSLAILPIIMSKGSITRLNGAIFVLAYVAYLYAILQRVSV
ncbi:MAG: calcium/sodium antiporter [Rhizobiales bacterium]|nr:calcium/sodium antiporter [Hyphomicrobiales bacterium]